MLQFSLAAKGCYFDYKILDVNLEIANLQEHRRFSNSAKSHILSFFILVRPANFPPTFCMYVLRTDKMTPAVAHYYQQLFISFSSFVKTYRWQTNIWATYFVHSDSCKTLYTRVDFTHVISLHLLSLRKQSLADFLQNRCS